MKKIACLVVGLLILMPVVLLAEEAATSQEKNLKAPRQEMGMMMGHRKMKCPCCMMMGKPSMVAAQDGGVIVLAGNKLQKYDAALNLVKEVEIKMPVMDPKQCPMMGKMGMRGMMEEPPQEEQPAGDVDAGPR